MRQCGVSGSGRWGRHRTGGEQQLEVEEAKLKKVTSWEERGGEWSIAQMVMRGRGRGVEN